MKAAKICPQVNIAIYRQRSSFVMSLEFVNSGIHELKKGSRGPLGPIAKYAHDTWPGYLISSW